MKGPEPEPEKEGPPHFIVLSIGAIRGHTLYSLDGRIFFTSPNGLESKLLRPPDPQQRRAQTHPALYQN